MNAGNVILWGFVATLVLTIILATSRPLGLTRMDIPFILGTIFTPNRNKAPLIGFALHMLLGWFFAFIYAAAFISTGLSNWWFGMSIGFIHAAFVLTVGLEILNFIHPRMASRLHGPTPTKQLEPPGFLALNYGRGTPFVTILGHLVYGGLLGVFC